MGDEGTADDIDRHCLTRIALEDGGKESCPFSACITSSGIVLGRGTITIKINIIITKITLLTIIMIIIHLLFIYLFTYLLFTFFFFFFFFNGRADILCIDDDDRID